MSEVELERQKYGLQTLKLLHDQLRDMPQNQFKKYPELSWIKWELEKLED
jgi:hypothetical protein